MFSSGSGFHKRKTSREKVGRKGRKPWTKIKKLQRPRNKDGSYNRYKNRRKWVKKEKTTNILWRSIKFWTIRSVNYRVPKTVRHGTSLHRICPKLLIDSSPSGFESIDSSLSQLESQTSVWRPTAKLFGLSCIRLDSQASVRQPTLKLIGSSHSRLKSTSFIRRPSLKPFSSSLRRLSCDRRGTC